VSSILTIFSEAEEDGGMTMTTLSKIYFKNTKRAMLYIENYLADAPLKKNKTYYGEVVAAESGEFLIEIVVSERKWFSKTTKRILVGGISSAELLAPDTSLPALSNIVKGDFVCWSCIDLSMAIPCGVIIKKVDLVLDLETNKFDN
jgi:hypothetical protein